MAPPQLPERPGIAARRGREFLTSIGFGCAIVAVGLGIGYLAGRRTDSVSDSPAANRLAAADSAQPVPVDGGHAAASLADTGSSDTNVPDTVFVVPAEYEFPLGDTAAAPTTTTADTSGAAIGYQTIIPPDEPPRPDDVWLIEQLIGQRVRITRRLLDEVWWTVERGEITEFDILELWTDPAGVSSGVRVRFVARAGDDGIEAVALLRYYGNHFGWVFKDLVPERVTRLSSR